MPERTLLDLAGVGAGPSNLSVAALAASRPALACRFFERQPTLRWHPGLLLADSVLQVSHLKDLVTLVDPTSPYTFLNFLARTGRLHRFASLNRPAISRREYERYLRWVADDLDSVRLGCAVHEVTFTGDAFRLSTDDGTYRARHLSVAIGSEPYVPPAAAGRLGPDVLHAAGFRDAPAEVLRRRVAVVGGGQSGAEVVDHLLGLPAGQRPASLCWISRRPSVQPLDETPFTNEWFHPDWVHHFHRLPAARRRELLAVQRLASDGVSTDLLERLYRRLYENDYVDDDPVPCLVLPGRDLHRLDPAGAGGLRLELTQLDTGARELHHADTVVLATGYRFRLPGFLAPLAGRIPLHADGEPVLDIDYSAAWEGPAGHKLFFLNAGRHSHGIADPNLSLGSWRAAAVLESVTGTAPTVRRPTSASRWRRTRHPGRPAPESEGSIPVAEQHLIVPSNPTPNGDLHLGHIAGPYLGADLLRRASEQRGDAASVLLGTAWQNTHVLISARRQGRDYLEVAAEFGDRIEESFAAAGIGYHVMLRHQDIPDIEAATHTAFARLRRDGSIVIRDAEAHYCTRCDDWRFQGFVAGSCKQCGSADASGIDCEGCGIYHDDAELVDARCVVCDTATTLRPLPRAFLELEGQRSWFERYLTTVDLGEPVRRYAETVLANPLPSVAVTFVGEVGFPAGDELPGQRIFPAFELAPRYTVMLRRLPRQAVPRGAASPRMSMLFGSDNAFERVLLFPAVLQALADEHAPLPSVMQMTYFYLLDGAKFSTSRRHLVGVQEVVDAHGLDTMRLFLAATRPEEGTSNFTRDGVAGSVQAAAVRQLREWADTGFTDPVAGAADGGWPELVRASADLDQALRPDRLSGVRAADAVVRLAGLAGSAAVQRDADLRRALLHCLVNGAAAVIPETAAQLGAAFAVPRAPFDGPPDD